LPTSLVVKNGSKILSRISGGVAHCKHHIRSGGDLAVSAGIVLIKKHIRRLECQLAARGHRIAGVDREIDNRRTQLRGIGQGGPGLCRQLPFYLDVLTQSGAQQSGGFSRHVIDVGLARLQRLLAGECEQLAGELGAAVGRFADQLGDCRVLRLVFHRVGKDVDCSRDDGQHIVEVMSDAAGQLADRIHFL
jgi:hypothetical protein